MWPRGEEQARVLLARRLELVVVVVVVRQGGWLFRNGRACRHRHRRVRGGASMTAFLPAGARTLRVGPRPAPGAAAAGSGAGTVVTRATGCRR